MKSKLAGLLLGGMLLTLTPQAKPCSRVLWADSGRGVLVGRNMDWFEDIGTNFWILPRGMERNGLTASNPLRWKSQFGSLVLTGHDVTTVDGLNERGLAVHMLYLPETQCGPRDESIPGMSISLWAQYYLDRFATVAEAVAMLRKETYQLQMANDPKSGKPAAVHLALNDATGDSAILECIAGKIVCYHSRDYTVMTNQPTFELQLKNLQQYRGFGGEKKLPGTHEPSDRFIRAAYYAKNLPKQKTDREAIAALMSVMRNVSAPFGEADPERPNVSTTIWRTVTDLTNQVLYYDSVYSAQIFWVKLVGISFEPGAGVRRLQVVGQFELMGDVSNQFQPATMFPFAPPTK